MRILHCICTHEVAGTERHVSELATFQAARHDVRVLLARSSADRETGADLATQLAGCTVTRAGRAGYAAALLREIRRFAPDIVHTHLGLASIRAGLISTALNRLPVRHPLPAFIATLHRAWVPRVYRRHDGLICIASWQKAGIPASFPGHVETISNWTRPCPPDPDHRARIRTELRIEDDTFLIAAGGRLIPEKGFDLLLDAFRRAALPRTQLVIAGTGPDRARLEAMAPKNVIFTGYRPSLREDMQGFDAFVLPSLREPFGLVLLEAMAAGLPVIATEAGGVPDILGTRPDCLVPPGDIPALTQALQRLHGQPRQKPDLSGFLLPAQAEKTETFYNICLNQKRSPERTRA
ncbi:glycosyltransferase [Acetobacter sp. AN02]|uniref:glycosyltransferase n=1 Tax=Acetobacter sp. AN02 TaxID=2894186 RepID=UPI0024343647|nr:glycosyltransferase [Acetobacter sp. AN02]MDG6095719.1 glycosyltransferase [Acetobacter sp. AN02]